MTCLMFFAVEGKTVRGQFKEVGRKHMPYSGQNY